PRPGPRGVAAPHPPRPGGRPPTQPPTPTPRNPPPRRAPTVVVEDDTTIWVPVGWKGKPGPAGTLVLTREDP
ncbi:MAG: hypothetical protein ABWZ14_11105, partial [Acidimicrobiales bacterium]